MDEHDQHPIISGGRAPDVVPLFLALFLLVLAFFIILVTISTPEKIKSTEVMDSLTSTFRTVLPPTTDPTDFNAKDGDVLAGEQFQERITGIFATYVQVARVEIVQPGRLMRIELPTAAVFAEGTAELRPGTVPLLDRIVASLSARPPGLRFDMELVIGSEPTADGDLPVGQTLQTARAGAFARTLESRGVPPDSLAVGIMAGDPRRLTIWFFVRGAEETRLRFGADDFGRTPAN